MGWAHAYITDKTRNMPPTKDDGSNNREYGIYTWTLFLLLRGERRGPACSACAFIIIIFFLIPRRIAD